MMEQAQATLLEKLQVNATYFSLRKNKYDIVTLFRPDCPRRGFRNR
jgi:hypothetical protein